MVVAHGDDRWVGERAAQRKRALDVQKKGSADVVVVVISLLTIARQCRQ